MTHFLNFCAAVVALNAAPAAARAASYFCPWADTVVELDFLDRGSSVELRYAIYPRKPILAIESVTHPIIPHRKLLHFRDTDGSYRYEFWFDPDIEQLWNRRVNLANGAALDQRGYCMQP